MSKNKLRTIIIIIIVVFIIGLIGISIRMAVNPGTALPAKIEKRTEAVSVLQSGFTWIS